MPRETHTAGAPVELACGMPGTVCAKASRGRGCGCTEKGGWETLCESGVSLTEREGLVGDREAAEAGARKTWLMFTGTGVRLCSSTGSRLAVSSVGAGGKATLGGGGAGARGGAGGGGGRISACKEEACSGLRPSGALPHTAPLPTLAPNR